MLSWFRADAENSIKSQLAALADEVRQQRAEMERFTRGPDDSWRGQIAVLADRMRSWQDEVRHWRLDLDSKMHDFHESVRREQDATGRQIMRRVDEAGVVAQQQFATIEQLVESIRGSHAFQAERMLELAEEAAQFYDAAASLLRDLPRVVDDEVSVRTAREAVEDRS